MGDPIKNLKFYQQFGFEQYVLCNEDCQEFFKWFSANITEDNILTESEISQYNDLVNEGRVLHGSELESELNRLNEEYPNILSYTERNVQQLEAQLERFVLLEERNENHLAEMKFVITNTSKKMLMLESEIAQCEQEEQTNVRNCFDNGKQLQDLQSTNQKSLLDVNQLFNKSQKPSLFIYQMPLDQYFQKCDQFLKFLEVYLHNNFKVQNFFEQNSEDDECSRLQMCRDLEDIKDRLYQKELKILNLNLNNSGIKAMIQTLKSNQLEPMSWSTLNGTIEQYSQQIQVNNMNIETVKSSIEHQLQLLTEQEIHFIVHQNNLEKLERATNRLNFLKNLSEIVSNSLLNAEMLWILMQLDMEKIDEWNKCEKLEEYRNEAQLCLKRMESMNHIIKSPIDNQLNAIIFQDLKNLLTNTLHIADEKLHDLRSCFVEFEKLTITFSNDLNKFAAATHNDLELFKKALSIEDQLNHYVMDGPVNKPNFINVQMLERLFKLSQEKQTIGNKLKDVKCDIQKYSSQNSDEFWRRRQLLWIYFLTEPKKILSALEDISSQVNNVTAPRNMNSSIFGTSKTLSGIKRKQ